MSKFQQKTFSVGGYSKGFTANYDAVFGKKKDVKRSARKQNEKGRKRP